MFKALLVLLLTGCATASPDAVTVKWIRVASADIHAVCAAEHGKAAAIVLGQYRGCTKFSRDSKTCTIWAPDFTLSERERMATLGHEIKHCFDGPWH